MKPPQAQVCRFHLPIRHYRAQAQREQVTERRPCPPWIARDCNTKPFNKESLKTNCKNGDQYQGSFARIDQPLRALKVSARRSHSDANHHQSTKDINDERLEVKIKPAAHDGGAKVRIERDDSRCDRQDYKAVGDQPVKET